MNKFRGIFVWIGLWLVSVLGLNASVLVHVTAQRGTVSGDGTSLGAFSASETSFSYRGLTWSGDASAVWSFDDIARSGALSSAVTVTYPGSSTPPTLIEAVMGGVDYVAYAGPLGPTLIAPLFETWDVISGSTTFTPVPDSEVIKIAGSSTGTVAGGGTFQLSVSGILDFAASTGNFSTAVKLFDVDPSIYGYTDGIFVAKASGTILAIPEPSAFAALGGVGVLGFAVVHRRRRVDTSQAAG